MIKVKQDTKIILETMKIVDKESFDEVIKRLILASDENEGSLTKATENLLRERMELKKQGKAISMNEIIDKMRQKRAGENKRNGRKI